MDMERALAKHGKSFESGTVLFCEGDPGSKLWIINEGHVQLTKRVCAQEVLIETLGPGEFCGELSLVTGGAQPVTATVVDNARMLIVDAPLFETLVRSNAELSIRMLKKLVGRLNEAQFRVSVMQLKNNVGRVMLQLRHEIQSSEVQNKATIPDDLADALALDSAELKNVLTLLVDKNLITLSKENVYSIVNGDEYDRFLNYLELRERYAFVDKV